MQGITTKGVCRTHDDKYTKDLCRGSMKRPVGEIIGEPKDYPEREFTEKDCFSGLVMLYLGGVVTGLFMGWWL